MLWARFSYTRTVVCPRVKVSENPTFLEEVVEMLQAETKVLY
jgi:hypothetical protein